MMNVKKTNDFLLFLLGTYGHAYFLNLHLAISLFPPELFSILCVTSVAIYLILHEQD